MTARAPSSYVIQGTEFVVASAAMTQFMGMVERVARHVGSVLIVGETGSGKELIARSIHEFSQRRGKPFVDINCAALPENLVESELFGYEKGAFSGADTAKPGLFELANSGTIFLDEIGELDLKLQVKLLRILDHAPYYRLGGHRKICVDVRVVAATNRKLKDEVSTGRFRKDLYHRLSQFELHVPPLRERREDIAALAEHFLSREKTPHRFSSEGIRALQEHSWPGNVRELQNVVNRLWVSASDMEIGAQAVQEELARSEADPPAASETQASREATTIDEMEATAIENALKQTGGHRGRAAAQLGISRRTLSRKLRLYGLASPRSLAPAGMGSLNYEQQQSFRADLRVPVSLQTNEGGTLTCTAINLSMKGMGLEGLEGSPDHHAPLRLRFVLPGEKTSVELQGRMAWSAGHGRAGIVFTDVDQPAWAQLSSWLRQKMVQEGWTVEASPNPQTVNDSGQAAAGAAATR
jgi:transcriptional regulator with AAA-type ATPase domain